MPGTEDMCVYMHVRMLCICVYIYTHIHMFCFCILTIALRSVMTPILQLGN